MSDIMKDFVSKELENQIRSKYPHLRSPACVYAMVTESYINDNKTYVNLKILDKNMNVDSEFPEIPYVMTDVKLSKNDIAVVLLVYGECSNPYIIGRYVDE